VLGIGKFDVNYLVDGEIYRTEVGSFASDVTLPEDPVKNGYSFDGWYLDDGEWNLPFSSETAKKKLNLADMSVYAKFTKLTYSIKYETLGGKHSNPATYTVTSENINLEPASHDNYKFVGWYENGEKVSDNAEYTFTVTTNHTLTAKFEKNAPVVVTYTVTTEVVGNGSATGDGTYEKGTEVTLTAEADEGNVFYKTVYPADL
jgi:uncharacterized repeat protein (TIGR02543 family)